MKYLKPKKYRHWIVTVRKQQSGIVLPLVAVAMLGMIAIVGLAVDSGHVMVNKTRLQNTLDAAALSGAKTLDQTNGDVVFSETAARSMFASNAAASGSHELLEAYNANQIVIDVEFSAELLPFTPNTAPAQYIRVQASQFNLPGFFTSVVGIGELEVAGSAVSGPSPTLNKVCNVAPMMVCGDPDAADAGDPYFGYEVGMPDVLKSGSTQGNWQVGPGNFQLVRLPGNAGAADIREALAGNFDSCVELEDTIETEPGNSVGPVAQGINTRFGSYNGPMNNSEDEYPPDVVVTQNTPELTYNTTTDTIFYQGNAINSPSDVNFYAYDEYLQDVQNGNYDYNPLDGDPAGIGSFGRRTMALPVGDCSATTNGQGSLPLLGTMCFHLLQEVRQQGNTAHVFGQVVAGSCGVTGKPGPTPGDGPGPYRIQLYKDPDAVSS